MEDNGDQNNQDEGSLNREPNLERPVLRETGLPLIDYLMATTAEHVSKKLYLDGVARSESPEHLIREGVPEEFVGITRLWAEHGPVLFTSYGHPEDLDHYKYIALANLRLYLDALDREGIVIPRERVHEIWYDTVPIRNSSRRPFTLGKHFPVSLELFDGESGGQRIDIADLYSRLDGAGIGDIAEQIYSRLHQYVYAVKSDSVGRKAMMGGNPALTHAGLRDGFIRVLRSRVDGCLGLYRGALADLRYNGMGGVSLWDEPVLRRDHSKLMTISRLLMQTELDLGRDLFSGSVHAGLLQDEMGIQYMLASDAHAQNALVMKTLECVVSTRGDECLLSYLEPYEGLFSGSAGGDQMMITKDDAGKCILMNSRTLETVEVIPPDGILYFAKSRRMQALSKAEGLSIVAGGALHFGSEHGIRERSLDFLGIDGPYAEHLMSLQIGKDHEQGNEVLAGPDGKSIPPLLALVLFGREYVAAAMRSVIGKTNVPIRMTRDDIGSAAVASILREVPCINSMEVGYGWYS